MEDKIKTQKEIISIRKKLKRQKKVVVTFNGSFDLLHLGHIRSLEEAKRQGGVLIALLNSDRSVKSYKSSRRPIVPERQRAETLAALECVDYVTLFDEINSINILDKVKPDIHCNGSDWGKGCVERETVEKNGGRIHIVKWTRGFSTTKLIEKIAKDCQKPVTKAIFLDRDGVINIDHGYVFKKEDFDFAPHAIRALQKLSKNDYKIIIVTNQSGIGRGYYTEEDYQKLKHWMLKCLKSQKVRVDAVYHCPHRPDEDCPHRKPNIGMALRAVKEFDISLNDSWIVGDSDKKDIGLGRAVNMKTIKVGEKTPRSAKLQPNHYAKNLLEAVEIILKK